MVGVFEKGKADVKFTARSNGGHASTPVKGTPIARLSAFVNEVETHSPFRKKMLPEVSAMFTALAPYAGFGMNWYLEICGCLALIKSGDAIAQCTGRSDVKDHDSVYGTEGIRCL